MYSLGQIIKVLSATGKYAAEIVRIGDPSDGWCMIYTHPLGLGKPLDPKAHDWRFNAFFGVPASSVQGLTGRNEDPS